MTTHIFLLFSFKSSSFASVRFKWPWRQNRIYQAKPVVRFQFINHNNFLNIQCYSIRCIYLYLLYYIYTLSTIYIPYQLGHGYKFYSFPYDAHFVLCRILFYQFKHNQKCRLLPDTTRWRNQRINREWVFTILCITKSSLDFSTKFDE